MGQRLPPEAINAEAIDLLKLALKMLDDGGRLLAAIHVAQAIDHLAMEPELRNGNELLPVSVDNDSSPKWGVLVDRPRS